MSFGRAGKRHGKCGRMRKAWPLARKRGGVNSFWRDRPVFITGGTGLLGSWLVKQLLEAGAKCGMPGARLVSASELVRSRGIEQVITVRGDIIDRDLIERTLGEYEVEIVFHLAAQTIVGIANRNPISTFSTNIEGTWNLLESCRRSPKVSSIVVRRPTKPMAIRSNFPTTRRCTARPASLRCQQVLRRSDRADVCRHLHLPVAITRCGNFYAAAT